MAWKLHCRLHCKICPLDFLERNACFCINRVEKIEVHFERKNKRFGIRFDWTGLFVSEMAMLISKGKTNGFLTIAASGYAALQNASELPVGSFIISVLFTHDERFLDYFGFRVCCFPKRFRMCFHHQRLVHSHHQRLFSLSMGWGANIMFCVSARLPVERVAAKQLVVFYLIISYRNISQVFFHWKYYQGVV